ncbi:MAG TPA: helix-turn-helix transcriptional regulator [Candidatus Limnocylindrales bacterium]|nr:helix-turn-helix transcriptional regulator [Candidatus Limnocylindrales bacterium]
MTTPGARLRAYMEARYLELGLGRRHGFVVDLERRSGVKRATLNGWFQRSSAPRLDALGAVADVLQLSRAELVAVFDGREVIELDRARAMVREEIARYAAEAPPQPEPSGSGAGGGPPRRSRAAS